MTETPSTGREREPTASPPRAVPRRSWVANVGQWVFAYTVAWSEFCLIAASLALLLGVSAANEALAVATLIAWIAATAVAVASCDEPKEPGTAAKRYGIAIATAVPGLLIALIAGMTVFLLPGLLILGVFGSPVLPWFHRGSPLWQRAALSVIGVAASAAIAWAGLTGGASSWTQPWVLIVVFGPFFAAGSATGALFALRTVGVPREVG